MPQSHEVLSMYGQRLQDAERNFKELNKGRIDGEDLKKAIIEGILAVHEKAKRAMELLRSTRETWDEVEYADGQSAAIAFAQSKGITDSALLKAIGEVGIHLTALRLQLETDDCEMYDEDSYDSNADAFTFGLDDLDPDDL